MKMYVKLHRQIDSQLLGSNFKKIITFGTKCFVRYSWHVRYLGCPLFGRFHCSWLKGICCHGGILILILIACLIIFLDRDKWQRSFSCIHKRHHLEMVEYTGNILNIEDILNMLVSVFRLFSFSIPINNQKVSYRSYVLCFWKIAYGCNIAYLQSPSEILRYARCFVAVVVEAVHLYIRFFIK